MTKHTIRKSTEGIAKLHQSVQDHKTKSKKAVQNKLAYATAQEFGLSPIYELEDFRKKLTLQIIQTVRLKKIRHIDVSVIAQIPRTKVTAIMNNHLEKISTDSLIRVSNSLGLSI